MKNIEQKYEYSWKVYEYVLEQLFEYLNCIHQVDYSIRFWDIIIGNWLHQFVAIYYIKYLEVKEDVEFINPLCYEKESWYTPNSIEDFHIVNYSDCYNEMIRDQIFLFLYPERAFEFVEYDWEEEKLESKQSLLKQALFNVSRYFNFSNTLVWDSYLKPKYELILYLKSWFKVHSILFKDNIKIYEKKDRKKYYFDLISSGDEFTKLFFRNLQYNFPTIYLEGFKDFMQDSLNKFKKRPKQLITGIGFYCNERLKFLAAYWQEQGTKIIGIQHGGSYGTSKIHSYRRWEKKVTDKWIKLGE